MWSGAPRRGVLVVTCLHRWSLLDVSRACVAASLSLVLVSCVTSNVTPTAGVAPSDATDSVRSADFSARFPVANEGDSRTSGSSRPFLFPGFDGADVQTVAKALLGDILQLNFVVDPRVQGNVTLASSGPIPRKDVLPAFESV